MNNKKMDKNKIAIIDADLIGRKKHRLPNLVCMKLSGYYKSNGYDVELKTNYDNLFDYNKLFISKVFTDTPIDSNILILPNVEYGGTGFFYDKAPRLPDEIEHSMPDYQSTKLIQETSLNEFVAIDHRKSTDERIEQIKKDIPDLANKYFNIKFSDKISNSVVK